MSSREIIYLGKGNTIDWQLQADGVAVDLSSVTRMTIEIDGKILDSVELDGNGQGNAFNWTGGVPAANDANLFLTLGAAAENAGVSAGNKRLKLTVYDSDHAAGLVWLSSESVKVV